MSFDDERPEGNDPSADVTRVLSHSDLIDLKCPVEKALAAIPDLVLGLSSHANTGTDDALEDLATVITALQIVHCNLDLGNVVDDIDKRIARAEGRAK